VPGHEASSRRRVLAFLQWIRRSSDEGLSGGRDGKRGRIGQDDDAELRDD
jgi:hypothetical protein